MDRPWSLVRRRVDRLDATVDAAFDRWRGRPLADRLFYATSELADHSVLWLLIGAVRGLRSERDWQAALRLGAALAAESALVNLGIKSLFRRTRPPSGAQRSLPLRQPLTSSFPSGHATAAFTAAGLLAEDEPLWPAYYALAVVVSLSRIHVGIHHASDVLAGTALGVALGRAGRRLVPLPPA